MFFLLGVLGALCGLIFYHFYQGGHGEDKKRRREEAVAEVVGSPFQVPSGTACASSGPAHRASSVAVPSVAHFHERLGSTAKGTDGVMP